jgi:tRNA modification GTPase
MTRSRGADRNDAGPSAGPLTPDTIFAVSTAPGRAAIAVLRIAGPNAGGALTALTRKPIPEPRRATLTHLYDLESGERLDDALVLWFPGPASEIGDDIVELHLHGGRAVVAGVIEALAKRPGLRPAEPGEFARRAFENDKLDLTAAEGLADLIDAETPAQRRQALRQMGGALAQLYDNWRDRLIRALAHVEAAIDFPDDEVPEDTVRSVVPDLDRLIEEMTSHLADSRRGEILRDGLHVAILGAPNVGKSSLLNALARRDVAIVSSRAGTTRDVIEVRLDLGGYPVILADTAGLRDAEEGEGETDPVEIEGIRRARARAEDADLRIVVFDAQDSGDLATQNMVNESSIIVVNKIDLTRNQTAVSVDDNQMVATSAVTGEGIDVLLARIESRAVVGLGAGDVPAITRARHRRGIEECRDALGRTRDAKLPELVAEDMRLAVRALGRITGRVDVEDILDVIFHDFCIGK